MQSATRWNPLKQVWESTLRGRAVLSEPRINKGTGFTVQEREDLGLIGLLPSRVLTIDEQAHRAYLLYLEQPTDLAKNVFLTALRDRNEVLYYRLLSDHLSEFLPIVYTPTVGEAIQRYSHEYRRPHGVYLSIADVDTMEQALLAATQGSRDIDLIIATDAEGILGIGDWGVGGIEIAVGKLNVYTAAAGINPARTLAVMLDVGTNRQELLDDPLYLGVSHERVGRDAYDAFIDRYVTTTGALFPDALLHWEDLGTSNARRVLERYRSRILTFNDDMQGTGAVSLAAVLSGSQISGVPLQDHRVIVHGSGTAGIGIADQLRDAMCVAGLTHEEATRRFWCIGRHGLLVDDRSDLRDFQSPYARPAAEVSHWATDERLGGISLAEVVRRVHPTVLIGTSGRPQVFTEAIVSEMAAHVERPIIMPMSNPTSLAEAFPADLLAWTKGRALVASGSPFRPVSLEGTTYDIAQVNNALIFPGLGLGVIVSRARRLTDGMLLAAAQAVAGQVDTTSRGASLLPQMIELRTTSIVVARAVAQQATVEGLADVPADQHLEQRITDAMWVSAYHPVIPV
ncbi:NAD-dependent malic enzyme [Tessaracoccus antarcticus]|uniref:Putative malate oxidoreductase [NAD] n=1 Tax=Tessaracoccus antarcticus TaxID=2479848 RepID=A0A3M0GGS3_9ACTN|nr:NAD-dependent malic enzyme [Tessaracoccus antarcticus]